MIVPLSFSSSPPTLSSPLPIPCLPSLKLLMITPFVSLAMLCNYLFNTTSMVISKYHFPSIEKINNTQINKQLFLWLILAIITLFQELWLICSMLIRLKSACIAIWIFLKSMYIVFLAFFTVTVWCFLMILEHIQHFQWEHHGDVCRMTFMRKWGGALAYAFAAGVCTPFWASAVGDTDPSLFQYTRNWFTHAKE